MDNVVKKRDWIKKRLKNLSTLFHLEGYKIMKPIGSCYKLSNSSNKT